MDARRTGPSRAASVSPIADRMALVRVRVRPITQCRAASVGPIADRMALVRATITVSASGSSKWGPTTDRTARRDAYEFFLPSETNLAATPSRFPVVVRLSTSTYSDPEALQLHATIAELLQPAGRKTLSRRRRQSAHRAPARLAAAPAGRQWRPHGRDPAAALLSCRCHLSRVVVPPIRVSCSGSLRLSFGIASEVKLVTNKSSRHSRVGHFTRTFWNDHLAIAQLQVRRTDKKAVSSITCRSCR